MKLIIIKTRCQGKTTDIVKAAVENDGIALVPGAAITIAREKAIELGWDKEKSASRILGYRDLEKAKQITREDKNAQIFIDDIEWYLATVLGISVGGIAIEISDRVFRI